MIRADGVGEWQMWNTGFSSRWKNLYLFETLCHLTCALTAPFFRRRRDLRVEDFPETNRWPGTALDLEVHSGRQREATKIKNRRLSDIPSYTLSQQRCSNRPFFQSVTKNHSSAHSSPSLSEDPTDKTPTTESNQKNIFSFAQTPDPSASDTHPLVPTPKIFTIVQTRISWQ